jgi:hypothetical protein
MAHPLDKVKISIDDPNCRGVNSENGLFRYDAKDHVVEVPRVEADKILKSGHPAAKSYRRIFSVGIDLKTKKEEP